MNNEKKEFIDTYGAYLVQQNIKNLEKCPSTLQLNQYFTEKLSKPETLAIEKHIDLCSACFAAIASLKAAEQRGTEDLVRQEDWDEIKATLSEKFYNYLNTAPVSQNEKRFFKSQFQVFKQKWQQIWDNLFSPYGLAYAGAAVVLIILAIYSSTYRSRSNYFELAQIEFGTQPVVRMETDTLTALSVGLKLFDKANYQPAIQKFETCLSQDPHNYIANYYSGLAYLLSAEKGIPGLGSSYDKIKTEAGIKYLDQACSLSDGNQFYLEDCYWFLGKAYLMQEDAVAAIAQFTKIINLSQPDLFRKEDARKMILIIQERAQTKSIK